jgi:hypothetical protein
MQVHGMFLGLLVLLQGQQDKYVFKEVQHSLTFFQLIIHIVSDLLQAVPTIQNQQHQIHNQYYQHLAL